MTLALDRDAITVTCLCAAWCGVCRDYRAVFDAMARRMPEVRFAWVDVEDEAARIEPIEVENFPTVLIAHGAVPLFFGPITPQASTLQRLVEAHAAPDQPAWHDPAVALLVTRLR